MKTFAYFVRRGGASDKRDVELLQRLIRQRKRKLEATFFESSSATNQPFEDRPAAAALLSRLIGGDTLIVGQIEDILISPDSRDVSRVLDVVLADVDLQVVQLAWTTAPGGWKTPLKIMAGAYARLSAKRLGAKIKASKLAARRQKAYLGGGEPFGWKIVKRGRDKIVVEDPETIKILRKIHHLKKRKKSLRAISAQLKAEGHQISYGTVFKILRRYPAGRILPRIGDT